MTPLRIDNNEILKGSDLYQTLEQSLKECTSSIGYDDKSSPKYKFKIEKNVMQEDKSKLLNANNNIGNIIHYFLIILPIIIFLIGSIGYIYNFLFIICILFSIFLSIIFFIIDSNIIIDK